jgi:hypothetical protein
METDTILEQLECNRGFFPEDAVREAIARRDEIVPHLLDILERAVSEPDKVPEDHVGHIFAMFLLAQFREPRAFPLLVRLGRLPGETPHELAGDTITEDFSAILASVCDADLDPIKALVEDPAVNEYVRAAGLRALTTVFFDGRLTRDELVAYHSYLLERGLEKEPAFVWSKLASCAAKIHPRENMEGLRRAYDQDLVELLYIGWDDIEQAASRSVDDVLAETRKRDGQLINDVVASMKWWACFQPQPPRAARGVKAKRDWKRPVVPANRARPKIGPNDPCPCGSGKKYKKCCWLTSGGMGAAGTPQGRES